MIKVYFYHTNARELDVESELGITEDIADFLIRKVPGLELEATDAAHDLDDNWILWFSAKNEAECVPRIHEVLKSHISALSQMQYRVTLTSEYSWYD